MIAASTPLQPLLRAIASLRRSPSRALLVAQAVALVLYPFAGDSRLGHLAASLLSVGVLSTAIWMVQRSPRQAWVAGLFAVLGVLVWQLHISIGSRGAGIAGAAFYAAAYFYAALALIGYMMSDEQTTVDEMWAAGATFMLFVEAYAWVFMGWQLVQPGAFAIAGQAPIRSWMDLVFLSGTNFSATGLSDIVPATPHARMWLLLEQWNGVMYLAIVVARLAGMLKKHRGGEGSGDGPTAG